MFPPGYFWLAAGTFSRVNASAGELKARSRIVFRSRCFRGVSTRIFCACCPSQSRQARFRAFSHLSPSLRLSTRALTLYFALVIGGNRLESGTVLGLTFLLGDNWGAAGTILRDNVADGGQLTCGGNDNEDKRFHWGHLGRSGNDIAG